MNRSACVTLGLGAWICLVGPVGAQPAVDLLDAGLDGWTIEGDADATWTGGVLRIEGPAGWLRSSARFTDFALIAEFRFLADDTDSGLFFRTEGTATFARGWPDRSYQVQMRNPATESPFPPIGGLFRHGMAEGPTDLDEAALRAAVRPTGEWQRLEIEVVGDTATVSLNGVRITSASGLVAAEGYVGIQAETSGIEFRSLAVTPLAR